MGSGVYKSTLFWNQSLNTHFQRSILTQIGFSSNLMVSGTAEQLDKSSWPSQILIVCRLGKGLTTPETQTLHQLQTGTRGSKPHPYDAYSTRPVLCFRSASLVRICHLIYSIISQNKVSKVSKCVILTKYGYFSCHRYKPANHPEFACIFSELATLYVVLVVPKPSEGGYKGLFCFEK